MGKAAVLRPVKVLATRQLPGEAWEELGPIELDCQVLFTEDQSMALLVLTAPPRTEGYEKLQLLAVLGQERFADAGQA